MSEPNIFCPPISFKYCSHIEEGAIRSKFPMRLGISPYLRGTFPFRIYVKSRFINFLEAYPVEMPPPLKSSAILLSNTSKSRFLSKSIGSIRSMISSISLDLTISSRMVSLARLGELFTSISQHFRS
jgi:hypothetical protein